MIQTNQRLTNLLVFNSKVKCISCTRAYNKANKLRTQKLYLDDIRLMKHKGRCYKNSSQGPARVEEKACVEDAHRLLYDDVG